MVISAYSFSLYTGPTEVTPWIGSWGECEEARKTAELDYLIIVLSVLCHV